MGRKKKTTGTSNSTSKNASNKLNKLDNTEDTIINKITKSRKDEHIKFQYYLKKLDKNIKLTEKQKEYINKIYNNDITFCTAPAGTGKTICACYALLKLLFEGKIEKIIFTKPIKESGENLGFLPGDIAQKIEPYAESFIYTCKKLLNPEIIDYLLETSYIENRPMAFMRGITFDHCGLFLDEGQNTLYQQIMLYITRIGQNSKMIIAGDITQSDIRKKETCLLDIINILDGVEGVVLHEFKREDIMRSKILIEITDRYEKWKEKNNL
jgi:phosphate starvation-inducible PhoH-like protein